MGPDYIQTWAQNFHCRLVVLTQPWGGERQAHQGYGYKYRCHTKCNRHPRMCLNKTNPTGISIEWTFTMPKNSIIADWPSTKDDLHSDLRLYWSYRDDLLVIDGVVMKGRCIIIPTF